MVSAISSSSSLMAALTAKLAQTQQANSTTATKTVFSTADANGDGKVTAEELAALSGSSSITKASAIVSATDKDGDNALSEEELAGFLNQLTSNGLNGSNNAQLAAARTDMMSAADADGDGSLTYDEFSSMKPDDVSDEQSQKLFASIDSDSDGSLSSDEMSAFEANRPPEGGMKGAMMGPPPPPSSSDDDEDDTSVTSILSKLIDSLSSADETDDVASTDTEDSTTTAQEKIFSFFDQDSDGTVSETELNDGVIALKTAMSKYMLSLQESRAAA